MDAHASPLITEFPDDASLGTILDILEDHADKALVLAYGDGRQVQAGYHITEVKAGSFVTLDCGAIPMRGERQSCRLRTFRRSRAAHL